MSFWDNTEVNTEAKAASFGGSDFEAFPNGTVLKAYIDEASVKTFTDGTRVVQLRWTVLEPDNAKNRKVFHPIKCFDLIAEKKDPEAYLKGQRNQLGTIAAMAGCFDRLKAAGEPNDMVLQGLLSKPMFITLGVWKGKDRKTGEDKSGNWVRGVALAGTPHVPNVVASGGQRPSASAPVAAATFDDEIPF